MEQGRSYNGRRAVLERVRCAGMRACVCVCVCGTYSSVGVRRVGSGGGGEGPCRWIRPGCGGASPSDARVLPTTKPSIAIVGGCRWSAGQAGQEQQY